MTSEENNNIKKDNGLEDDWMIRPSSVYDEEYGDCTSIRGRFHQYFVHGKTIDCSQWKRDSDNCYKWEDNKDSKAGQEIIASEKIRRLERLTPHYNNNIWQKRKNPPDDWNKPLPEDMLKEYEHSYLNIKTKEMKGEIEPVIDSKFCVVM